MNTHIHCGVSCLVSCVFDVFARYNDMGAPRDGGV